MSFSLHGVLDLDLACCGLDSKSDRLRFVLVGDWLY